MPPSFVLSLFISGGLAAAAPRSDAGGCRDGLDVLYNESGYSPCAVEEQMQKACMNGSNNITECTCNNVMYNVCAACALCQGDSAEDWTGWASSVGCTGQPLAFPSNIGLPQGTLPKWAQLPLTANQDFDVAEAVRVGTTLTGVSKSSVAVQVAVPIVTAVGVALFAVVTFWLCWRRKSRKYRDPHPSETACTTSPSWAWIHKVYPFEHAKRLRPCKKNSDWAIDEDRQWLGHTRGQSSASYIDPYVLAQSPVQEEPLGLDVPHTSAHIKETSSTSLLPHLPEVRVPTFMERLVNFKDGLRKSPSYKVKHVSPVSPDAQFRIDGYSGDTPVKPGFARANREVNPRQPLSVGPGAGTSGSERTNGSEGLSGSNAAQPAHTEHSDFDSQPDGVGSSVLLISRDGEDFSLEDYATTAADHSQATTPRTPRTFRTMISVLSGSRSNTGTSSRSVTGTGSRSNTGMSSRSNTGTGSWLSSASRANTASTVEGAYPLELRRNPDLMSSRTNPPHVFSASAAPFHPLPDRIPLPAQDPQS